MAGSSEDVNKPPGSIKWGEFLDQMRAQGLFPILLISKLVIQGLFPM